MIKELVNFIEDLEQNDPEIHQKNVELKEGLYLFIRFEEGGKITIVNQLPYYEKKVGDTKITKEQIKDTQLALYQRCLSLQQVLVPVAQTKIFNPNAKIFGVTCSPFALGFNKKNIDGGADKKDTQAQKVKEAIIQYFETAKKYIDVTDEALKLQFTTWYNLFSDYCKQNLITLLDTIEDYKSIKEGGIFNVFLILDEPNYSHFKLVHDSYFSKNIFNNKASITLSVTDIFNSHKIERNIITNSANTHNMFQWNERMFVLNFTYRFSQNDKNINFEVDKDKSIMF